MITEDEMTTLEVAPRTGISPILQGGSPVQQVKALRELAAELAPLLNQPGFFIEIPDERGRPRRYTTVEGWTFVGGAVGAFPHIEWTRPIDGGWEARCVVKTPDGREISAAEAMCLRSESIYSRRAGREIERWKDEHSVRSMAQTRAIAKALSAALRFVVRLAGFEGTPAEEMVGVSPARVAPPAPSAEEATEQATGTWTAERPKNGRKVTIQRRNPQIEEAKQRLVDERNDLIDEIVSTTLTILSLRAGEEVSETEAWRAADKSAMAHYGRPLRELEARELQGLLERAQKARDELTGD
jgi:hypothetical protein